MTFNQFKTECEMYEHSKDYFESNKLAREIEVMREYLTNQLFMAENGIVNCGGEAAISAGYLTESASIEDLEAITESFKEKANKYWEIAKKWVQNMIAKFAQFLLKISGNSGLLTAEEAKKAVSLEDDTWLQCVESIQSTEKKWGYSIIAKAWNAANNKISEIKDKVEETRNLSKDKKAALNKLTRDLTIGVGTLVVRPIGDSRKAVHTKILADFLEKANTAVEKRNAHDLEILSSMINKAVVKCRNGVEITCKKEDLANMAETLENTIKDVNAAADADDKEAENITTLANDVRKKLAELVSSTINIYNLINDEAAIIRRAIKQSSSSKPATATP